MLTGKKANFLQYHIHKESSNKIMFKRSKQHFKT